MAFAEENWQTARPSIKERCKFVFNNELFSDVKFVVRESNGESESQKIISAHKFVLAISSPVFEAMFYGKMAETKDSIHLPDCEYNGLLETFRYIYSDEVNLSKSNVMQVLYLAKKYMLPSLADKCSAYLRANLNATNVFFFLPQAQSIGEKELVDQCWQLIETKTDEVVKSAEFVTIEKSLVESLVKREVLKVKEVELFKAVDRWATSESERQSLTPSGDVKRRILDEEIVKSIRFPLMSESEFVGVVPDCNILTMTEIVDIMKHFNHVLTTPLKFLQSPRIAASKRLQRCSRFAKTRCQTCTGNISGNFDGICLYVNIDINLHGVHLYLCESKDYIVTLIVKRVNSIPFFVMKPISSSSGKYHPDGHYGLDVFFDSPVRLNEGVVYVVEVEFCNFKSYGSCDFKRWMGEQGNKFVKCSKVTFTFIETGKFGSSIDHGQFTEFIFTTCS